MTDETRQPPAADVAPSPFALAERAIVDWLEANGYQVTCSAGEWFFEDEEINFSISEMANAVARQLTISHRPESTS